MGTTRHVNGVGILVSGNADFIEKGDQLHTRSFVTTEGATHQENATVPNHSISRYSEQNRTEPRGQTDRPAVTAREAVTPQNPRDKQTGHRGRG